MDAQGAFRRVAAEAEASAKELAALLKRRMAADRGAAAECIPLVRRLGEPIESLQARFSRFPLALPPRIQP